MPEHPETQTTNGCEKMIKWINNAIKRFNLTPEDRAILRDIKREIENVKT